MFPWILCCILLIVVFFLITKIIFIEKSIDEIHTEFQERLSSDTNTLIDISSSDPHLRKLASEINIQLRLREYPKVCVNLQTGVRYNYSVWRFLLWQEEKVTHHRKQQCAK